uniref:Uncharacterized protein n=1 Tax=Ananas comosus var. bracteatus TaxID=296719 RepID=A0A6V7Q059_ANACO|nr:unnamed protein product [Ananas comosus var. bracteatus]
MHSILEVLLLSLLLLLLTKATKAGRTEVKKFPGFDGELPSKHYAGYITVGSEFPRRHIYYYFALSERNPIEDPITLWINGGPGCSAFSGLVQLMGPFKIMDNPIHVKDLGMIKRNPFSWTKWFSEYSEFILNPFYLAGCSYSGVVVPMLALEIMNGNGEGIRTKLNFKGYSLGNAAIDINIENNAAVTYAYQLGLISDELYKVISL